MFRIRLNSSYDGNALVQDEVVFPEDSAFDRTEALQMCDEEQVVYELWRDGRVPEWIDVCVIGEIGSATLLELTCCGRFTADETLLYHERQGHPPFQVTGPVLPIGWKKGDKFSVYDRAECWSSYELERLRDHVHEVWSLRLFGAAFDDQTLVGLPALSRMEILELTASSIEGTGLTGLGRFPRLRILRIGLARNDAFQIPKLLSMLPALEGFDITDPPLRPWGFHDLTEHAPALTSLNFRSRGELFVDGDCPNTTSSLSIAATRIAGGLALPATIDAVYAHVSEMTDRDADLWLSSATQIRALDLEGTKITDAFAETLPARFGLTYLNVARTNVGKATVERIASAHPKLKLLHR